MCVCVFFPNTLRFFSHSQEHINKNLGNQDQINITSGMEVQSQMFLAIVRQNCVLFYSLVSGSLLYKMQGRPSG